jgi:hypothetical protein
MRTLYAASLAALLLTLGLAGCRKENGIDNETVILKPYAVFVADGEGALFSTNNGDEYTTLFTPDGFASRAIVTAGTNIIWVKNNLFTSEDNGLNFNARYFYSRAGVPWQQMILYVPSHGRVYISSAQDRTVAYSEDNGVMWKADRAFDTLLGPGAITSFAQLGTGALFGYSNDSNRIYRRDNKDDKWSETFPNNLPVDSSFYLHNFNNILTLSSYRGGNGVWYSNDSGRNWTQYGGVPQRKIYCTASPLNQVLLIGTDSTGIYRSVNGTSAFVPANSGLDLYTSVYGITGKDNQYKNGRVLQYVYIATSTGVYRSEDGGQNWIKVKPGVHRSIY